MTSVTSLLSAAHDKLAGHFGRGLAPIVLLLLVLTALHVAWSLTGALVAFVFHLPLTVLLLGAVVVFALRRRA
jgi:uncharacterized integral membrane protein